MRLRYNDGLFFIHYKNELRYYIYQTFNCYNVDEPLLTKLFDGPKCFPNTPTP